MRPRTVIIFIVCGLMVFLFWNYITSEDYSASAARPTASPSAPVLIGLLEQAASMTAAPSLTPSLTPSIIPTFTPNAEQTALTNRLNADSTATETRRNVIQTAEAWDATATVISATEIPAMTGAVIALGTNIANAIATNEMGTQIAETATPQAIINERNQVINNNLPCIVAILVFMAVLVAGCVCMYFSERIKAIQEQRASARAARKAIEQGLTDENVVQQPVNQFTREHGGGYMESYQQVELLDEAEIQGLIKAIKKGIPLSLRPLVAAGIFTDPKWRVCRHKLLYVPIDGGEAYAVEGDKRVLRLTATGYQAIGLTPPAPPQDEKSPENAENTGKTQRNTTQHTGEVVDGGAEGG